jgi:hypothetical protein
MTYGQNSTVGEIMARRHYDAGRAWQNLVSLGFADDPDLRCYFVAGYCLSAASPSSAQDQERVPLATIEAMARLVCEWNDQDPDASLGGDGQNYLWHEAAETLVKPMLILLGRTTPAGALERLKDALRRATENCGSWMREARSRREQAASLLEAIEAILPSTLCGERWNLADEETVSITVTFGKLRAARTAVLNARGAA